MPRTRTPHASPIDPEPRAEEKPTLYPQGRVCAARGCRTILHHYHKGPSCYVHEPARPTLIRTLDEYESLMEAA